jgi:hypothetical protein
MLSKASGMLSNLISMAFHLCMFKNKKLKYFNAILLYNLTPHVFIVPLDLGL